MPADDTSPYLEQLAQLASPVPDFAATLNYAEDANDENVSFLRTPADDSEDTDSDDGTRRRLYTTTNDFRHGHAQREVQRRAMRRAVLQTRRYTPAQLREFIDSQESLSTSQTLRQQDSYQGWAPGSSDADRLAIEDVERYLERTSTRHRDFERETDVEEPFPVGPSRNGNRISNAGQSHFIENGIGSEPTTTESSLRTTALLQSVRRHARISARSRDHLENYIIERARRTNLFDHDWEEVGSRTITPLQAHQEALVDEDPQQRQQQSVQQRNQRARMRVLHTLQRIHHPDCSNPDLSVHLEEAIKYLERLRYCNTYADRISSATEGGLVKGEFFTQNHADFILDTTAIAAPPETSWLKVGGVFTGSQHAATISPSRPHYLLDRSTPSSSSAQDSSTNPPRIPRNSSFRTPVQSSSRGSWITRHAASAATNADGEDRWPVKVTIHSIDYSNMTLSGTMEAFNVPDKSSPTNKSSITTFLEGEIIDFNKFTLETKSFKANPRVDGTYWRKLEPFKGLSDKEMVKNLVSVKWLTEELGRKWILMRWKG